MAEKTYIVAEIGTSHGGNIERATELVSAAAAAGADCAKFQLVIADEIISAETGDVPLPGGSVPLFSRFSELERQIDFYRTLKETTERAGLDFLCTPFGSRSAAMLRDLSVSRIKIASPELNHHPLLREVAGFGVPIFLSAGVSMLSDIEEALEIVGNGKTTLLHCVTAYPAPAQEYNLRILPLLSRLFGVRVGVSDHSTDPELVPALAVSQGACVVEKHITLSRTSGGLDDRVALEPAAFERMVQAIREAEQRDENQTIDALGLIHGMDMVEAVLGDGRKRLAPSERANYGRTNRSIHATRMLSAGTCLSLEDIAVLRTEKVLRPGLHPRHVEAVIGRVLARDVPVGQGIGWDDLVGVCR